MEKCPGSPRPDLTDGEIRAELKRIEQRFQDFMQAHFREHRLLDIQVASTKEELTIKLREMNEMRAQIADERGQYELRDRSDVLHKSLVDRITLSENASAGLRGQLIGIGAAITTVVLLVELAFKFLGK